MKKEIDKLKRRGSLLFEKRSKNSYSIAVGRPACGTLRPKTKLTKFFCLFLFTKGRFPTGLLLMLLWAGAARADVSSTGRVGTFAKLPNWSGLWEEFKAGASGGPDDPAELKQQIALSFVHPPYNAQWAAKAAAAATARARGPDKLCGNLGFPSLMIGSALMFEAIVTPEETALTFDFQETRHIYTDGQPLPPVDERFGTTWGTSVGHWEGQTLVVDTVASSAPVDPEGDPISDQATYHERIRLIDKNTLQDLLTITDPTALTHPWHLTRTYTRVPNMTRFVEEECYGNTRDQRVNGTFTIAPP